MSQNLCSAINNLNKNGINNEFEKNRLDRKLEDLNGVVKDFQIGKKFKTCIYI
jgi:hypothetical protein|tara:strand:+ start:488 stop:646 length:159 start_codon:yes stop_codon:yes gene_type:complete